jgi:hypothetical protein
MFFGYWKNMAREGGSWWQAAVAGDWPRAADDVRLVFHGR